MFRCQTLTHGTDLRRLPLELECDNTDYSYRLVVMPAVNIVKQNFSAIQTTFSWATAFLAGIYGVRSKLCRTRLQIWAEAAMVQGTLVKDNICSRRLCPHSQHDKKSFGFASHHSIFYMSGKFLLSYGMSQKHSRLRGSFNLVAQGHETLTRRFKPLFLNTFFRL